MYHLFDNLESGKRNDCFGKKCGKSLEFWIQKSVGTLYIVIKSKFTYFSSFVPEPVEFDVTVVT